MQRSLHHTECLGEQDDILYKWSHHMHQHYTEASRYDMHCSFQHTTPSRDKMELRFKEFQKEQCEAYGEQCEAYGE